jgi:hypothetical protein
LGGREDGDGDGLSDPNSQEEMTEDIGDARERGYEVASSAGVDVRVLKERRRGAIEDRDRGRRRV